MSKQSDISKAAAALGKRGGQIIRKITTIRELPAGWLAKERGTTYKTAHAALQATRREDRRIARDIPEAAVVRFINWEPTTSAGRSIILALQ